MEHEGAGQQSTLPFSVMVRYSYSDTVFEGEELILVSLDDAESRIGGWVKELKDKILETIGAKMPELDHVDDSELHVIV